MKKTEVFIPTILAFGLTAGLVWGQSQSTPPSTQSSAPGAQSSAPQVKVGSAAAAKAATPAPSASATNKSSKTSIGKGKTTVKTSQPSSFWVESIDINGDGKPEETDMLYDADRGVLYSAYEGEFTCQNGQTGTGSILEAVATKGNKAGKPVGSGWYLVDVDEGKCGAKAAAAYGCKFDASQNPTECGLATLNEATGELDIAVASN
jgi:hypothetical protein